MKGKKIIIVSITINILLIGIIYNFINKVYLNDQRIIVKALTEGEYENPITLLNQSHEEYTNYIQASKVKLASAITEMGVLTSDEDTLENMANNIKSISKNTELKLIEYQGSASKSLTLNTTIDAGYSSAIIFANASGSSGTGITITSSTSETVKQLSYGYQTTANVFGNRQWVYQIDFDDTSISHVITTKLTISGSSAYGMHASVFAK